MGSIQETYVSVLEPMTSPAPLFAALLVGFCLTRKPAELSWSRQFSEMSQRSPLPLGIRSRRFTGSSQLFQLIALVGAARLRVR